MLRKIVITLFFITIIAGCVAYVFGGRALRRWAEVPLEVAPERVVELARGEGLAQLAGQLEGAQIVSSRWLFRLYVRWEGTFRRFQAGKYRFTGPTRPVDVVNAMVEGKIYTPIVLQIVIPEGFQLNKIVDRMAAHELGEASEIKKLTRDKKFLTELKVPSMTLEGYLFPATYNFSTMPTAKSALQAMVVRFWEQLPHSYEPSVATMGLSLAQAVTFASLIEAETPHDDEKPAVAEVIWRRLKGNEPLDIDAALIYGIAGYQGDITWKHLRDSGNLYNTRLHKGLPPTPIGSPSLASLQAVIGPTNEGYYFYVAKADGSRRHFFSKTLTEHNRYVRELVKTTRPR